MEVGEKELKAAALRVDDMLAMLERSGGVEFEGDVHLYRGADGADGGFDFVTETNLMHLLAENEFAFLIHRHLGDGDVLGDLLRSGTGTGFGLDARGVEMLHAASLHSGEQFIEFGPMIALACGFCGEPAQQRAGSRPSAG